MSNKDEVVGIGNAADDSKKKVDDLNKALGNLYASGSKGSGGIKEVSGAFNALTQTVKAGTKTIDSFLGVAGSMANKMPGVLGDMAGGAVTALRTINDAFGKLTSEVGEGTQKMISSLDSQTRGLRDFENDMFSLEKRFGGTIDESKRFANAIRHTSTKGLAKALRMTGTEMGEFMKATRNTSLTQKQLSQVVSTGAGAIELYGAATAFAAASSMGAQESAALLNSLMNKQGKSAQEATNMLGMYVGVTKETGLGIDKVVSSLNGAVSGFAKIGMAADFGKPILQGFTDTMKEMGLGIEESLGLTSKLTGALAGLSTNYGMAHMTFQRGGLDIGGGGGKGVLGAGIALQSAYLEAEKTGDQAAISDQLVRGMRDTVSSLTGGDIITVQQANEDDSLASQFYMQQQLLKNTYNVGDDNDASRVLDMLSRLDEATRSGDVEAQKNLKEQLSKEVEGRDKTLDEMEKVNRNLEAQINLMVITHRDKIDSTREIASLAGAVANEYVSSTGMDLVKGGLEKAQGPLAESALKFMEKLGISADSPAAKMYAATAKDSGLRSTYAQRGASLGGFVNQGDAQLAISGVTRDGTAVTKESMRNILAKTGVGEIGQGSTVLKKDIEMAAMQIAAQADSSQLGAGGRAGLMAQLVKDFSESLRPLEVKISLDDQLKADVRSGRDVAKSVRKVASGGSSK